MSNDPSVRRLLPQNSHLGQFSYAPPAYQQPRETQKNYVFVDEHNRHKRLKVMRACEGCRRRKIKCDAATTNTWPCSACIRLKLHCVRPNGQYDGSADSQPYETPRSDYETGPMPDDFRQMSSHPQSMMSGQPKAAMYGTQGPYSDGHHVYQAVPYAAPPPAQHNMHYTTMPPVGVMDQSYAPANVFPTPPMHHQQAPHSESSPESYTQDHYGQNNDLSDLLGSLKMDERGTELKAPYLDKMLALRNVEDEPVTEDADDFKVSLPSSSVPGSKIRIPPELMPDEETILHYFDLYFANVHPYVPVLNKAQFYQQWHTNRDSISPLILEAIFAVAGRLADEPALGQQWIALASKHADAFMDVPRLSTLQALLIILKAREASPKKGYYYRSWMSIVNCIAMAKDLDLHEHYEDHKAGKPCGSSPADCLTKTRIWQTIFICELMIGSPQGRHDLSVDLESLDFSVPRPMPGGDDAEYHVTRNFTYFARSVRSVRRMNNVYARIKRRKDWGIDPEFVQLNPSMNSWLSDLPADLSVTFAPDGSPPWLPSHFIGNLHSYYYLAVLMLHRPQLNFLDPNSHDGQWKSHMVLCLSSAKLLCRLQEAMLQSFGLSGLQCMQRGISFTIYAVLTCIPLYLVALTSPDPDLNSDARDYFTRHMRILEKTMGSWPMPEMVKQIDAVREAFSADLRKPFVLKPSFPYGSPVQGHSTPPRANGIKPPMLRTSSVDQVSYTSHPITPPISASPVDNKSDSSPAIQSLVMMASGQNSQAPSLPHGISMAEPPTWNPSRIFDQWNSTFGTPQPTSVPPQSSSLSVPPSSGTPEVPSIQALQSANASMPSGQAMPPQQYSAAPVQSFVTPAMWQESVASVYEGGIKRHWDAR
ncbi:lipase regulator 1 [Seiridium cupressi]